LRNQGLWLTILRGIKKICLINKRNKMKKVFLIFVMIFSHIISNAQNKISGKVTDQNNLPLIGANIFVPEMNKGTVTDNNGTYELSNLPNGKIKIQFSYLGYANRIVTAELTGEELEINISLKETAIEAEEIVITGGYSSTQHENAVKTEVLKLNILETKNTPNFMEVITQIPGVDMISKGSGVSKPVIRGLSMNDILVLNNGVRFENYQYSDHHPLGIDEFGIENVEIIKGPASLLYGSDAIGGVINFIKEKPAPIGSIIGDYNLQVFSNTLGMTNNLGIKGASKKFFGGLRFGHKSNADFLQGGGIFAPNSRFNEISIKTNTGYTDKTGTFKLFYDYINQKLGLVEDEAIKEITERGRKNEIFFQELNTHLLASQNKLYIGKYKLDLNSAFQHTELIHIGNIGVFELQMALATLTYDVKIHLPSKEDSEYIIGFQGFTQTNTNLKNRETILLPDAKTNNVSAFGLLQHTFFKKVKFQTGIRYDKKIISAKSVGLATDSMTYRAPLNKSYGSFSGSVGATINIIDRLIFRANLAAAYRTPNLAELTSNGQHELRYEIGDKNLVSENSYEADISFHYHKNNLTFDLAGFYNLINNYIFISPTGDTTVTGIEIYKYKQANSNLFGGEAGFHIHPEKFRWLHIETTFSYVIGKKENGEYLPFVPAHNLRFELRGEMEKLMLINNVFMSISTCTAFNQNHPAPDETKTTGYTLIDLSIGGKIKTRNQYILLSICAKNILDTKYIDHLSTLKDVNYYNPGRNISFNLKVPFEISVNKHNS
jgi:iron complex outermembrane receptor protein